MIEQSTQCLTQAFEQRIQAAQTQRDIAPRLHAAVLAWQANILGDGALLRSGASDDLSFAAAAFRSFLALIER